jgi:tetratricopeptide (TPR) repeat protein
MRNTKIHNIEKSSERDRELKAEARQSELKWLEKLHSNPEDSQVHFNIGEARYVQGKMKEALESFSFATLLNPQDHNSIYYRGQIHYFSGEFEKAIREFQSVIKLFPNHSHAHSYFGSCLMELGKFEEAVSEFERAVHHINHPVLKSEQLVYLAQANLANGSTNDTKANCRTAIKLDPNNEEAKNLLSTLDNS